MSKTVVRSKDVPGVLIRQGGMYVSLGEIQWSKIDGRYAAMEPSLMEQLDIQSDRPVDTGDTIVTPMTILIDHPGGRSSLAYVERQNDIAYVARSLSKLAGCRASITARARILLTYDKGQQVGQLRTLDDFYVELSAEEIQASVIELPEEETLGVSVSK